MHLESLEVINEKIQAACKRLWDRNMLASADGNISFRLSDEQIAITPSGVAKAFMQPQEMCLINLQGQVLKGRPSAERSMHLEIYRSCPLARAVVHAHPPHAIAWSVAYPELEELPSESLSEVILSAGHVPIVKYARPTTEDMGIVLRPHLPHSRLMLLSRHGGLAWGESLDEAVNGMERLEHSAQILFLAKNLNGLSSLPEKEIQALRKMRKEIGERLL